MENESFSLGHVCVRKRYVAAPAKYPMAASSVIFLRYQIKSIFSIPMAATPAADPITSKLQVSDRKSTRLNSSHVKSSYAVFCLKKKNTKTQVAHPELVEVREGERPGHLLRAQILA